MFALEETEISKAIDRARELHPVVRVVRFGEYTVTGSKGNVYTVRCYRGQDGLKYCDCTCQTRDGVACKHAMAAVALHLYMAAVQYVIKRQEQRRAARSH
jgi:hypothetical protein